MSWLELSEVLGNLGEFIGSIAVLVTLVYLALQVKQTKLLLERSERVSLSQVHQARADTRINYLLQVASLSNLAIDSLYDTPSKVCDLSSEELIIAKNMMRAAIAVQDNVLYQNELGLLDEQTLPATNKVILAYYNVWEELGLPVPARLKIYYESIR